MSHIIVIFDRSGSMGEPFQIFKKPRKRKFASLEIKIEVAKESLINWLQNSKFEKITLIPFSSRAERKRTFSIDGETKKIRDHIRNQFPDGDTNLQAAITSALKTGKMDSENSYVQYLIVTDGLSHTVDDDLRLVQKLPITQSISGILIDPTNEGEAHLKKLCVRGSYMPVTGEKEFVNVLEIQNKSYSERIKLSQDANKVIKKGSVISERLAKAEQKIKNSLGISKELEIVITESGRKNKVVSEIKKDIMEKIADQNVEITTISTKLSDLEQEQTALDEITDLLEMYDDVLQGLKISILGPRFLSKGYSTALVVDIEPIKDQIKGLKQKIRKLTGTSKLYSTLLVLGLTVSVKLECSEIKFSDVITKKLKSSSNIFKFNAKPNSDSKSGCYEAVLTVYNNKNGLKYETRTVNIKVVDFAFLTIPKPFLLLILIAVLGLISSMAMVFALTKLNNPAIESGISVITGIFAIISYLNYKRNYAKYVVLN
jgi:hypothetical protein